MQARIPVRSLIAEAQERLVNPLTGARATRIRATAVGTGAKRQWTGEE
jgi:hypothetical protein